jgi:hypothetical protein
MTFEPEIRSNRSAEDINYCNFAVRIPKMTISQLEAEGSRVGDEQGTFLDENSKTSATSSNGLQNKRNPPARNTSRFWFERFLAVIQRQNPSVIDASFLSQIAPSNEGKLLAQLKYLGVIDEQGKPTKLLPMLNMVGDEQKKAFQEIAREAYRELQSEVKMEKAVSDDLVNFFIRKYAFSRDKAINASKFYLYLAEKSGNPISPELGSFVNEKSASSMQSGNSSVVQTVKAVDRPIVRSLVRDARIPGNSSLNRQSQQRKIRLGEAVEDKNPIQAIINIKLEKDTPKEYWDRVLALLGEKQRVETNTETVDRSDPQSSENIDQELSADSAFT